ncbi:hypothetical protein [uncultured Alistipes sp.]|uniref:hypothetical protein n=1 Tax=uncultured Alistipes sp. TaxID=538949 RepID=UPI0026357DC6|nr:hypothetical protein [uncultured Alistipes sp.]
MAKGIDPKFVHYGIRKDDLATIEAICEAESIDFNWLSEEILKAYHAKGDFYTNAQYPLIMKQHTIDNKVIKDLYGVSGQELQEVHSAIAGLQKGKLIIKDQMAFALGMGKKYKKINV